MRAMTAAACTLALLLGAASLPVAGQEKYPTVNYKRAGDHLGEIAWVQGTVLKILNESEGIYLCFHNNDKYIRVLVPTKYVESFEGKFKHRYLGKKIKAIGKIDKFGTQLIVAVSEPKRIRVVEEAS